MEILQVQEIRNFEQPTKIVSAPDHVLGVIHLRGVIVPIVDLRMRLGVSEATFGQLTVVVILNLRGRVVGVVVDSVSEVLEIQEGQVHPASEWRGGADIGYVKGLGCVRQNDAERMVILLDIEGLLGSTAFAAN